MSESSKQRRRGASSHRYPPARLVPHNVVSRGRIDSMQMSAAGAVIVVAFALITLIWMVTSLFIRDEQGQIQEAAERVIVGQAMTMAQEVSHELLLIDQSLSILQAAWKADSDKVELVEWKQTMPAAAAVAADMFIADEQHIIRQDILPQAVGQGVGAAYVAFPHGSLEVLDGDGMKTDASTLLQPSTAAPIDARQFLMYIVRPLDHPRGWIVGAAYRSENLTKMFAQAALGYNSLVAVVDTRQAQLQIIVGTAARQPRIDLSKTTMYQVMNRSASGAWQGDSGIDGVERIHAYRHIPGRDMLLVVAASTAAVLAPADSLITATRLLGVIASGITLLIAGMVAWGLVTRRATRRRQRAMARDKMEFERLQADAVSNLAAAQLNAARLQALMSNGSDGVALVDAGLRIVLWNHRFEHGIGVALKQGLPLDVLLREQARLGLFEATPDAEVTIAQRSVRLRTGEGGLAQPGPLGHPLWLRGLPLREGGFILLLTELAAALTEPATAGEPAGQAAPEPTASARTEW